MINIEDIQVKWQSLNKIDGKIKSLMIDGKCVPDLFIGLNPEFKRCLILKLPAEFIADFQSSVKQNLALELFPESKWIVLTLLDEQFNDLFDDLIFSIYNKISNIADPSLYVSDFLQTYYKWSEFFQDNNSTLLSDEDIQGLFGELLVLNEMVRANSATEINNILNNWKGPYDARHDFIGDEKNIEVKTKVVSSIYIKISSEYQLQPDAGKELELHVVSIIQNSATGFTLKDLVLLIKSYVTSKLGDYTIILTTLSQKGLTARNLSDYDHLKFMPVSIQGFYVTNSAFPRLIRSELPDAINTVNYKLNLTELKNFIIFENPLQWK
ncbi:MAG TPA: PD-(D/E)XK motif protein [Saprospiraceae bacterium]|nr:PD-(D/E)XK motif protein [Saprospiraceae bacterium]